MKQFFRIIINCLAVLTLLSTGASAQVNITTKKVRIADFQTRTTKVVLTGDPMFDTALKSEVSRRWRVSPYEFVTLDEYESVKTNSNYYFLMLVDQRSDKSNDSGVSMFSLFKGGVKDQKADNALVSVVDFPFCPAADPDGREYVFLPAVIDIIQNYALDAMQSDRVGYGGLISIVSRIGKVPGQTVYFSLGDLAPGVVADTRWADSGVFLVEEEEADRIFDEETEGVLVSYTVSPSNPDRNSFCYKMIIDTGTHELCYFGRHKVGISDKAGFDSAEITSIAKKLR